MTVTGTKHKMLVIAREFFWKKGHNATSLEKIANAYGCKPADIYNFFKKKLDLLLDISIHCRRKACFSSTTVIRAKSF